MVLEMVSSFQNHYITILTINGADGWNKGIFNAVWVEKREICLVNFCQKPVFLQAPVAHACNPSYSGGRDQEVCSSKPAQANNSAKPYLEKPFTKKGWWSGSR
jgi:hypothetical protein